MAQEIIGKTSTKFGGTDSNKAVPKPSPADNDKNQAVPKTDLQRAFPAGVPIGIRKPDTSPVGPSIFDKES
jgi:hypothetical protein